MRNEKKMVLTMCISIVYCSSCNDKCAVERPFFKEMKEHYSFVELEEKLKDVAQIAKEFGISNGANIYDEKCYYNIYGLGLKGYVRMENDKVFLLAEEGSQREYPQIDSLNREHLFIDFSAQVGAKWEICYTSNAFFCDEVEFIGKTEYLNTEDTLFVYKLSELNKLNVPQIASESDEYFYFSKKYGLVSFVESYGTLGGYRIDFYPIPKIYELGIGK